MKITVRLFAAYRERVGQKEVALELPEGATLRDAWQALVAQHEGLAAFNHSIVGSINAEYSPLHTPLQPGDEIAFIPPVAGGDHFAIVDGPIDERALRQAVEDAGAGAILVFLGTTRNQTGGRAVEYLEYEAYEALALRGMETIAAEIRERWPDVKGVALVHRVGRLEIGAASIGIAVATPHRTQAFSACRYAIDRAKETLAVWKKEVWEGGEEWIEEGPGTTL